ncbi:MAG: hypothetical protein RLZZ511_605 [Cyanobacteriota bacterium]
MPRTWLSSGIPSSDCNLTAPVSGCEPCDANYRLILRVRSNGIVVMRLLTDMFCFMID